MTYNVEHRLNKREQGRQPSASYRPNQYEHPMSYMPQGMPEGRVSQRVSKSFSQPAIGTKQHGHAVVQQLQHRSNGYRDTQECVTNPDEAWKIVLSELALQMPGATFDTWVRDTWVVEHENDVYTIGLPNSYARDWLENRLRNTIKRTLSSIVHRSVQVRFQVCTQSVDDKPDTELTPLQRMVEEAEIMAETIDETVAERVAERVGEATIGSITGQVASEIVVPKRPVPKIEVAETEDVGIKNRSDKDMTINFPPPPSKTKNFSTSVDQMSSISDKTTSYKTAQTSSPVSPQHTFGTFVVGNHNRLAHAAASAVSENPGQSFNPLFIYGGVGLGKTHLLHAIGNNAQQYGSTMLYCTSEQFTNELIAAIRSQDTEAFRNKYRQTDILLIDDIQFIGGKESTQEEFFHTFNHLHSGGGQVVLSSDRPPKALATLEERLRSRFEGGLQTDISKPDFETRAAILQSKAARMKQPIPHNVLMLVAERVDSNIRELEGALNRLVIQAQLANADLNFALAKSILDNLAPQRTPCTPEKAVGIVAEHYQLSSENLVGRKRTKDVARARQVAMYLLREENGLSLPAIGDQLGGRDHSTIRYGVDKIAEDLTKDEILRREVIVLRDKIYTPFIG